MRDIRSDLQERATLIDVQIRAAYSHFEKTVEQLKNEHNVRVADLKSGLTMIAKLIEFEQRCFSPDSHPVHRPDSPPVQSSALVTLADLFMHRLNEGGPMSTEELVALAVKEGFFADTEPPRLFGGLCSPTRSGLRTTRTTRDAGLTNQRQRSRLRSRDRMP